MMLLFYITIKLVYSPHPYDLQQLVDEIIEENEHEFVDFGEAVGAEAL